MTFGIEHSSTRYRLDTPSLPAVVAHTLLTYLSFSLQVLNDVSLGKSIGPNMPGQILGGPPLAGHGSSLLVHQCVGVVPDALHFVRFLLLAVQKLNVVEHGLTSIFQHNL